LKLDRQDKFDLAFIPKLAFRAVRFLAYCASTSALSTGYRYNKDRIKTFYRRHEASIGNERDQISARIRHHAVHCSRLDANRSGEVRDRGAAHNATGAGESAGDGSTVLDTLLDND
jgi:hypothetical protein